MKQKHKKSLSPETGIEEIQQLIREAAAPRGKFVTALKRQVLSGTTENPRTNLMSHFMKKLSPKFIKIGGIAVATVLVAGTVTLAYLTQPVSLANQQEILRKIAQANENRTQDSRAETMSSEKKMDAALTMMLAEKDYNFRTAKTTYSYGVAANSCAAMVPYEGVVTSEEVKEFYSNKKEPQAKYSSYATYVGGDVFEYHLFAENVEWEYRGGSYAVRLLNVPRMYLLEASTKMTDTGNESEGTDVVTEVPVIDEETSEEIPPMENENPNQAPEMPGEILPSEEPPVAPEPTVEPIDPIKERFGENAKLLGQTTSNGRKAYKIEWSYQGYCAFPEGPAGDTVVSSEGDTKIVIVALADSETFEIFSESFYKGTTATRNHIFTREVSEVKQDGVSENAVKEQFQFPFQVETRDVDYAKTNYEQAYRQGVFAELRKKGGNVVTLSEGFTFQSINIPNITVIVETEKHRYDRNFYSPAAYGTKAFTNMTRVHSSSNKGAQASVILSYEGKKSPLSWVTLYNYAGQPPLSDIALGLGYDNAFSEIGTATVQISGNSVTGSVYSLTAGGRNPGGSAEDQKLPREEIQATRDILAVFSIEGNTIVVQSHLPATTQAADVSKWLKFQVVSVSDQTALDKAFPPVEAGGIPELYAR